MRWLSYYRSAVKASFLRNGQEAASGLWQLALASCVLPVFAGIALVDGISDPERLVGAVVAALLCLATASVAATVLVVVARRKGLLADGDS